jgi:hypothetical protein
MRSWQIERRKRTRHLIELGGLVVKAGIVELTGDDRTIILGALLCMAGKLQGDQGEHARAALGREGEAGVRGRPSIATLTAEPHIPLEVCRVATTSELAVSAHFWPPSGLGCDLILGKTTLRNVCTSRKTRTDRAQSENRRGSADPRAKGRIVSCVAG